MRFALILSLLLMLAPGSAFAQEEVYQQGQFTVRKVFDPKARTRICKLEIAIPLDGRPAVILAMFQGEYFDELITERERIGRPRSQVVIQFDQESPIEVPFSPAPGGWSTNDAHWEWQYLRETGGLLAEIKRRNKMEIRFSNGENEFQFSVSLRGSSRAVQALRSCRPESADGS